jgi:hypothetical protein
MADVGIGQLATLTGRYRSKKLKDAVTDALPVTGAMKADGGIRRISGGRTIADEGVTAQNATVAWVGEAGSVSLTDQKIADSPEFSWKYILGAVSWTLAELYQNGGEAKYIDLLSAKFKALEASMQNTFHEGILSSGTGSSGLQLGGLAALVSTTPTTGTVGGIDRSSSNAAWFRNQKFDSSSDWSLSTVDAGNVKKFLDKGLNAVTREAFKPQVQLGIMGATHFEALTAATQAIQQIVNVSDTAKVGFNKIIYRGVPMYFGAGVSYSSKTQATATRTYLLNVEEGGFNLVYHNKAEFDMLDPVDSSDQAAKSRLMFTMANCTVGPLAKLCWVGFD